MIYDKTMIDLIYQIRKASPPQLRQQLKLSNPDLLDLLVRYGAQTTESSQRKRIEQCLLLAGDSWLETMMQRRRALQRNVINHSVAGLAQAAGTAQASRSG